MNVVTSNDIGRGRGRGFGRGCGHARGRDFGHGPGHKYRNFSNFKRKPHHQKWTKNEKKPKGNMMGQSVESICHRCGVKGHWSRTRRTSKHLVDLYQASLKSVKTNFTEQHDPVGLSQLETHFGGENQIDPLNYTHMEVSDFFEDGNTEVAKFDGDDAN